MVTSIPTFQLKVSEGIIDVDTSADRLYGYCVEANKGPIMEPTIVYSAYEAKMKFGLDFAPHFAQNPVGVCICRVGFADASKAKYEYKMYPEGTTTTGEGASAETVGTGQPNTSATDANKKTVLVVESISEGPCDAQAIIKAATTGRGYDLIVKINEPDTDTNINKKYSSIGSLKYVARKINNVFGYWLKATLTEDYKTYATTLGAEKSIEWFDVPAADVDLENTSVGVLTGGSNGFMRNADGEVTSTPVYHETNGINGTSQADSAVKSRQVTLERAYNDAFNKIQEVDLIGMAVMTESTFVQDLLVEHINHVVDPEIHQLRFGIIGYPDYAKKEDDTEHPITVDDLKLQPALYDNPWIVYVGQGVIFTENGIDRKIYPHQAVQLYTGIRSALGYAEAIFGGEDKKVLRNVTDVLPLVTDGSEITRELREDLNQSGVCTFKKEYGEVTFLEGVTTTQDDDVLSYENMMSIVANVIRRLIRICKPYQGQLLTEDLKSTLQTALSSELQEITNNEGTLMALEDFNIPPYDVQVYSAGKTRWDETNKLVRENKIIVQCKIVPVGALRDIDLGVIVI